MVHLLSGFRGRGFTGDLAEEITFDLRQKEKVRFLDEGGSVCGSGKGKSICTMCSRNFKGVWSPCTIQKGSRDVLRSFKLGSLVCPFREFGFYPVTGY